jgi:hypothetical protein
VSPKRHNRIRPGGYCTAAVLPLIALCAITLPAQVVVSSPVAKSARAGAPPERSVSSRQFLGSQANAGQSGLTQQKSRPNYEAGSPKHIFFIIPAFSVEYLKNVPPLTPHQKFHEWAEGVYDPIALGSRAVETTLEHSRTDGFCGYGNGLAGFGKCFGSTQLDADSSSFLGDFLFPTWLHQDPRYFRMGEGYSPATRALYAVSRVFITRSDAGNTIINTSALLGSTIAAADSNLYYPKHDRGVGLSLGRLAWDLGGTAAFNLEAEFWPDVKHFFANRF